MKKPAKGHTGKLRETEAEGVCVTLGPRSHNGQSSVCHIFLYLSCEVADILVPQVFVWNEPHCHEIFYFFVI